MININDYSNLKIYIFTISSINPVTNSTEFSNKKNL